MRYGGLIVAAGISSRLGQFKPMLPLGRETIIRRLVRLMKEAEAEPVVVVTGYDRKKLEEHLWDLGVTFIHNEHYTATKMFDSAVLGFKELEGHCERIFFSPADVPLIRDDTLQMLKRPDERITAPVYHKIPGHPIVLDQSVLPAIMNYRGQEGLQGAIKACGVPVCEVQVKDEGTIMDVDCKKDYERMLMENAVYSGEKERLRMELKLSIGTDELCLDSSMVTFLELISITGSMSAACQAMHMSYTKGWRMMNKLEEKLGVKVLQRNAGGREGGGSMLTPEGYDILQNYNKMMQEIYKVGEDLFRTYFCDG